MRLLFIFLLVSASLACTAGTVCHLSFESDALPAGSTFQVPEPGQPPIFSDVVPAGEIWDGGSLALLLEKNRRSVYFGKFPANSRAPQGGEIRIDDSDNRFRLPDITVETFVKVDEHQERFSLLVSKRRRNDGSSWGLSINPEGVFSVRLDTQKTSSEPGFNRTVSSGIAVNDGHWHHLAMTYHGESRECSLFVDYVLTRKGRTPGPLIYDDGELTIGRGLNGWIDEVRISDTVLHQEQFLRGTRFFTDALSRQTPKLNVMLDLTPTRVQTGLSLDWPRAGTLKPKSVDEIPGDFWSLGCETLDRGLADWDAYKEYLRSLGIRRIRLQGGWAKTEIKKGIYDFEWLDHIVDGAHDLGLKVCLETSYGNKLYEPSAALGPGGTLPEGEETLKAWDAWVEAMVRHYAPKGVSEWMMYNEPNLNKKNTPEKVVAFNSRTAEIIRRIDPDAKIAGLVASGLSAFWIENWLRGLQELGTLNLFQWVVYHGYGANPDSLCGGMAKMNERVRGYSPAIRLWQGEAGCASEEVQYALSGIGWTEISHAKWNARRMLCDFAYGIESSVFTISDVSYHKDFISRYGLLKTNPDNSLIKVKAAYYAVNNVVSIFNDDLAVAPNDRVHLPGTPGLCAYAFTHKASGYDLIALWDRSGIPIHECDLQYVTVSVDDLKIDDPVWVDLLTGQIYAIPGEKTARQGTTTVFVDLPVFDSPVVVTDRSILSYVKAREPKKSTAKKTQKRAPGKAVPLDSYRLYSTQKPAPAVILCHLPDSSGTWAAKLSEALRNSGVHAFVFTDRSVGIAAAVAYVRSQAVEWQINPDQIGLLGQGPAPAAYGALGANFAVSIGGDTEAGLQVDANIKALPGTVMEEDVGDNAAWLQDLTEWLEPRKTRVF